MAIITYSGTHSRLTGGESFPSVDQLTARAPASPPIGLANSGSYFGTWDNPWAGAEGQMIEPGGAPVRPTVPVNSAVTAVLFDTQFNSGISGLDSGNTAGDIHQHAPDVGLDAATITYDWDLTPGFLIMNDTFTAGSQAAPAIGAFKNGSYFGTWDEPGGGNSSIQGRIIESDGTPADGQFLVNSTTANDQFDSSVAGLKNGNAVVTFTDKSADAGGDIRARLFTSDGTAIDLDFAIDTSSLNDADSDVVALTNGRFAVSWTRDLGGGDLDVRMRIFDADGSPHSGVIPVNNSGTVRTSASSIAALSQGGVVVAWEQEPLGGGDSEVWFQRYDRNGTALGNSVRIDTSGSINEDIQIVGLNDGGFAVAYTDNGWNIDGTEITVKLFNADGTARTSFLRPNFHTAANQELPSLTVMSNGYVVVGWKGSTYQLGYQAYDPNGNEIGANHSASSNSLIEGELAALTGGLVASVFSSSFNEPGGEGASIRSSISELVRATNGTRFNETLRGDDLRDLINGSGGDDLLLGLGGDDALTGGQGKDGLFGGDGRDDFIFTKTSHSADNAADADIVEDFRRKDDTIDVTAIDANAGVDGDQAFVFIGSSGFEAPGEVRAVQSGSDTIIQFNTAGNGGAEMMIRLADFIASQLRYSDFDL